MSKAKPSGVESSLTSASRSAVVVTVLYSTSTKSPMIGGGDPPLLALASPSNPRPSCWPDAGKPLDGVSCGSAMKAGSGTCLRTVLNSRSNRVLATSSRSYFQKRVSSILKSIGASFEIVVNHRPSKAKSRFSSSSLRTRFAPRNSLVGIASISSSSSYTFSSRSRPLSTANAAFSPTPGTPGMLSEGSP